MQILFKIFLICTFLIQSQNGKAQEITGQILDVKTNQPLAFVNIGIIGQNIGTVSDEFGNFRLLISEAFDADILRFSYVGYKPFDASVQSFKNTGSYQPIMMQPEPIKLNEIIVTSKLLKTQRMGVPKKKCYPIPLFKGATSNVSFPQHNNRHEIGTLFHNRKLIYLDSLQFNLIEYLIDTLDFRINLYSRIGDEFVNVLKKPIYLHATDLKSVPTLVINLAHLKIHFETDFLVAIENYKRIDDNSFKILSNFKSIGKKYPTFYRSTSQSNWVNAKLKSKDFGLSFLAFIRY